MPRSPAAALLVSDRISLCSSGCLRTMSVVLILRVTTPFGVKRPFHRDGISDILHIRHLHHNEKR